VKIVLRDERTETDTRRLVVVPHEGGIRLDGHDLGNGVDEFWGCREYEWTCDVAADALPQLVTALGGAAGEDIFEVIRRTCGHDPTRLHLTITEAKIPNKFWSRVGD
jgi:hypothetical protein